MSHIAIPPPWRKHYLNTKLTDRCFHQCRRGLSTTLTTADLAEPEVGWFMTDADWFITDDPRVYRAIDVTLYLCLLRRGIYRY